MDSDFDLKNDEIPVIEPKGLFNWWVRCMLGVSFVILFVAYKIFI